MATIVHDLKNKDWKTLKDMYKEGFLNGLCYPFAIALHEGLGWPMVGLFVKELWTECICHAGVRSPDGKIFDIRGFVTEEEFGKSYTKPPYDVREININDLNGGAPHGDYAIQRARRIAEALWPKLPWKKSNLSELVAFVDELETLSRKHSKWIRTPPGTSLSQIQEGDGSEIGYEIRPRIDGFGYTINCYLR